MSFVQLLRLVLSALNARRGRSLLTVLSITIGTFAIVVMSSLAESSLQTLQRGIEDLGGARILMVVPKVPERGEGKQWAYPSGFTEADRLRIFTELPSVAASSMFSRLRKKEILLESGMRLRTDVIAADAGFFEAFQMRIARGRAFGEDENARRASVCVIGHDLANRLGGPDPLGHFVSVGNYRCRVIGVFADNHRLGVGFGFDWTDLLVAPAQSLGDRDPAVDARASVILKTESPSANELVKRLINARMVRGHPGIDDFTIFDFGKTMDRFRAVFSAMELVVGVLAGIGLWIGGIGVMNMMLIAVSERVREIGIRKALGARPRDIGRQFLLEAIVLVAMGASIGVALGVGTSLLAAYGIARVVPTWQMSLAPEASLVSLAVATLIGLVFGWFPAVRAARLDPAFAIRMG